jgi:hypothetical protein
VTDKQPPDVAAPDYVPPDETEIERARRLAAAGMPSNSRSDYAPQFCQVVKTIRGTLSGTVEECAEACGVSVRTIRQWQARHPEFDDAMRAGKARMVERLVDSLYKRALGYEIEEEKALVVRGAIRRISVMTHIPPNPASLFFALENLDPANWHNPMKMDPAAKPAEVTDAPMSTEEWDHKFGRSNGTNGAAH